MSSYYKFVTYHFISLVKAIVDDCMYQCDNALPGNSTPNYPKNLDAFGDGL